MAVVVAAVDGGERVGQVARGTKSTMVNNEAFSCRGCLAGQKTDPAANTTDNY